MPAEPPLSLSVAGNCRNNQDKGDELGEAAQDKNRFPENGDRNRSMARPIMPLGEHSVQQEQNCRSQTDGNQLLSGQ